LTNPEIYELLEKNTELITNMGEHSSIIKHILKTQSKILRELIVDIPEAGNINSVKTGDWPPKL